MATTSTPTNAVLKSHRPYRVSKNNTRRCSSVGGSL
jgi:hypothetical protein